MKKLYFIFITLLFAPLFFLSQQSSVNNVNGYYADRGSFEILSNYQGRNNVLKVDRSKTNWYTAAYSLAQYRGKQIAIEFSADIRLEGSTGQIAFQVNTSDWRDLINTQSSLATGQWHTIKGRGIITPTQNDSIFFLANWAIPENTIVYLANPTVRITEGNFVPDLSLTPLKTTYENHFLIGCITDWDGKYSREPYFNLYKHHFNSATSIVTMPQLIMPLNKGGAYRFTKADNAVNLLIRNNIPVHGFVLAYYGGGMWGTPEWITEGTREEVIQNLNDYITTVVRHFRGRINSWDVINEPIKNSVSNAEARGDWRNCIYVDDHFENRWYKKLGADYIELAFRAARTADPNIKLYLSEFNLECPNKSEVLRKMIDDINTRYKRETGGTRNLIEGIGWQGHLGLNTNIPITRTNFQNFNIDRTIINYRNTLRRLSSLGIEIVISEVDISTVGHIHRTGMDSDMSERDAITQGLYYARLFSLFKEFSDQIVRVSFWGLTDNTSWLSPGNPLLFDWKLNAKPAFFAVIDPESFIREHGGRRR
ncbi:MAG: endo-1,4-beta-xylanase [Treponema sp.]|nr:endo-1,4-beta-xylanase [Treponema sp.]